LLNRKILYGLYWGTVNEINKVKPNLSVLLKILKTSLRPVVWSGSKLNRICSNE